MLQSLNPATIIFISLLTISCVSPQFPEPPPRAYTLPTPTAAPDHRLTRQQQAAVINTYLLAAHWAETTTSTAKEDPQSFHQAFLNMPDMSCAASLPPATAILHLAPCQATNVPLPFHLWSNRPPHARLPVINLALIHLWTSTDPTAVLPPKAAFATGTLISPDNHPHYALIHKTYAPCHEPAKHAPFFLTAGSPTDMATAWLNAAKAYSLCVNTITPPPPPPPQQTRTP